MSQDSEWAVLQALQTSVKQKQGGPAPKKQRPDNNKKDDNLLDNRNAQADSLPFENNPFDNDQVNVNDVLAVSPINSPQESAAAVIDRPVNNERAPLVLPQAGAAAVIDRPVNNKRALIVSPQAGAAANDPNQKRKSPAKKQTANNVGQFKSFDNSIVTGSVDNNNVNINVQIPKEDFMSEMFKDRGVVEVETDQLRRMRSMLNSLIPVSSQ